MVLRRAINCEMIIIKVSGNIHVHCVLVSLHDLNPFGTAHEILGVGGGGGGYILFLFLMRIVSTFLPALIESR